MVVTDFDGTLFSDSHNVSPKDISTLEMLGSIGEVRVIATGRSLYSAFRVIQPEFPIDYLVFSSGAGIMDWKSKRIIKSFSLNRAQIQKTVGILNENRLDFMLHKKIPDNHFFYFKKCSDKADDFEARCNVYSRCSMEWDDEAVISMDEACQFVVIVNEENENDHVSRYISLKEKLESLGSLHIIRTTSPLDRKTLWIEIFPEGVSKAHAVRSIADMAGIDYPSIAAVGNDYNDIDLLRWVKNGFIVGNAPDDLKREFINVKSNNESGFSDAVEKWLNIQFLSKVKGGEYVG